MNHARKVGSKESLLSFSGHISESSLSRNMTYTPVLCRGPATGLKSQLLAAVRD